MKRYSGLLLVLLLFSACEVVVIAPADPRDQITGHYSLVEYSDTYNVEVTFPIRISKLYADGQTILIHNFYDVGISVEARYIGGDIIIPWQVRDGYEIEGGGYRVGREIDLEYSVFDQYTGGYTDFCYATAY